ncbi:hypothetical protein RQP46_000296 [Phenoliferia psychrophenolica]
MYSYNSLYTPTKIGGGIKIIVDTPTYSPPGARPRLRDPDRIVSPPPLVLPAKPATPARVPHLPDEILALIVESIPHASAFARCLDPPSRMFDYEEDRINAFLNCTLASKALRNAARKCLFTKVDISMVCTMETDQEPEHAKPGFLGLVAACRLDSRTLDLVRTVKILLIHRRPQVEPPPLKLRMMCSIMSRFDRLRKLVLYLPDNERDAERVLMGLTKSCPPLESLQLSITESFPPTHYVADFLRAQPSLKELDLTANSENSPPPARNPLLFQTSAPPTFHLRKLEIFASEVGQLAFDFLTLHSSSSLSTLKIETCWTTPISFTHLTHLHSLHLHSDQRIDLIESSLDVSHLPLHDLTLLSPLSSTAPLLSLLPPTLQVLSLRTALSPQEVLTVLDMQNFSLVREIEFTKRTSEAWSPAQQIEIGRACRRRGLKLEMPPPADLDRWQEHLDFIKGHKEDSMNGIQSVRSWFRFGTRLQM